MQITKVLYSFRLLILARKGIKNFYNIFKVFKTFHTNEAQYQFPVSILIFSFFFLISGFQFPVTVPCLSSYFQFLVQFPIAVASSNFSSISQFRFLVPVRIHCLSVPDPLYSTNCLFQFIIPFPLPTSTFRLFSSVQLWKLLKRQPPICGQGGTVGKWTECACV